MRRLVFFALGSDGRNCGHSHMSVKEANACGSERLARPFGVVEFNLLTNRMTLHHTEDQ